MTSRRDTPLRLVSDEYGRATTFGRLRIVAAPSESPPFPVDAVAVEEDTHLVLSAAPEVREPVGRVDEALAEAVSVQPVAPGSVLVGRGTPQRLLAVVHDVDSDPTWREAWVERAVDEILRIAAARRYRSLGLPALGSRHGKMRPARFALIVKRALRRQIPPRMQRLWLIVDAADGTRLIDTLRERG